ncbi:MAG TPA: FtsX-like permease family protein [Candidatus Paceibacterota bacterium]|nr:FtsX-like permease family protein [Candidatus Paceibacterota bacterium]
MILTFLNLVVVSGLLVGLIEGAVVTIREHYISDIFISKLKEKNYIEDSQNIIATLQNIPGVSSFSPRYLVSGIIEANYQDRTDFNNLPEETAAIIAGIDFEKENAVTGLGSLIVEGEYLDNDDFDQVIVGAMLLDRYLDIDSPSFTVLRDVEIGSKIKLKIGDEAREVTVKGITRGKADEIDRRVFINDKQLRNMIGRSDLNVGEISIAVDDQYKPEFVRDVLLQNGFGRYARIQTFDEAQPKFIIDMKNTFALLGTIISSIGLIVAAITIFIVIFINAITRRKYIGIMKAIGTNGRSIELAYVFQSLIYAIVGSVIGLILVYVVLVPYFNGNPIDFPFSDGILVAPALVTMIRVCVLIVVTALAGYIPARIIVTKNTLDSILGRK